MEPKKNENKSILIVEDEPAIADVLIQLFRFGGFEVLRAADGEQALAVVATTLPTLIILDISMPKMDGWEVCKRLKADARTKDIPVLIYSTKASREDREHGRALGALQHISKEEESPLTVLKAVQGILEDK